MKTSAQILQVFPGVIKLLHFGSIVPVRFNMGKTADLTTGQKRIIDTLHWMGKPQKFIAKEAGCSQNAVSKHINGESSGRAK